MLDTYAPVDSRSIRCAYQLCSYPTARAKSINRQHLSRWPEQPIPPALRQAQAELTKAEAGPG
eukprot:6235657-Pyramimonas_sp.AAC.1